MPSCRRYLVDLVGRARARHWLPALLVALSSLALSQSEPTSRFAAGAEGIDPRYDATLRELVATPSGRAFLEALQLIEREYLYTTDREALLRGATAGLIAALDDPYSRYVEPDVVAARRAGEMPETEVHAVMLGDVGYVRIRAFEGEAVGVSVGSAIDGHLASGALGLVLDLRGNDGGSILQGLQVLDRFLADGVLGFRRVRGVSIPIAYANPRSVTKPLVVLVDGTTASTAEIVAGALQAYGRAKIVGTVTAGKGIGQSAIELSDGSEIHLVSFEWLLPGFRSIDGTGLRPDVEVAIAWPAEDGDVPWEVKGVHDAVTDPALRAALELLREVVGDELSALLTVPVPAPQVGPTMVPVPTQVDEPPSSEERSDETADPADPADAPPGAPPAPPAGSGPAAPPGTAAPGTDPLPAPPVAMEPMGPAWQGAPVGPDAPAGPGDGAPPSDVDGGPPAGEAVAGDDAPAADEPPAADDAPDAGEPPVTDDSPPPDGPPPVEADPVGGEPPAAGEPAVADEPPSDDLPSGGDEPSSDDAPPVDDEPPGTGEPSGADEPRLERAAAVDGGSAAGCPEREARGGAESHGARGLPSAVARSGP
jgi:C-terminal processing protease CtpA/Prc